MSQVKMLCKKITIGVGCLGLFLAIATPPISGAQAKTKKSPKTEARSEPSAKSPLDLNTASEQDLVDLPGIGPALAKKIIAGRPYSSVSELSKASVPERTIKKITPMVTTGSASATAATKTLPSTKPAAASATEPDAAPATTSSKPVKKSASSPQVTQAAGGGNGKVWVNTNTGVYHKEGDRWYGRTKKGKYMTEDEAIKAGYRVDKTDKKDN